MGIDRDVFVKLCPLPGLWGHRIYKFTKKINKSEDDFINFQDLICAVRCLCRSDDDELDHYLFQIFDLCETNAIEQEELIQMIINLPDIGFSNS